MSFSERDQRDFQKAAGLHQSGQLQAAIDGYRKILKRSPKLPVVLNLLGLAEFQSGELEAAARDLAKALSFDPRIPDIHYNLATVLQRLGRFEEAIPHFEQAIDAKPNDADAHVNFGIALKSLGRTDDALREYERALALNPNHAGAHLNIGNALAAQGREAEAVPHLEKSIALHPGNPDAYTSLGNALRALERVEEAIPHFRKAIALNPQSAEAFACMGLALAVKKEFDEAAGFFLRATQLKPDFTEVYAELGNALRKMNRPDEAIPYFERAIELKPDFAEAYQNLALCYHSLDLFDEMLAPLEKALSLKPDFPDAITGLGVYYFQKQDYEKSSGFFQQSLALDPSLAWTHVAYGNLLAAMDRNQEAVQYLNKALSPDYDLDRTRAWNLGFLYLSLEEFRLGWDLFEQRFQRSRHAPAYRDYAAPQWSGEKVKGSLVAWAEQGLGDQILYASMLPELKQHAGRVVVEISPRLVPLFKRSFENIDVVPLDAEKLYAGEVASHISLGSLGKILRPNPQSFVRFEHGFLRADEARATNLRRRITSASKFAVGVSWRSKNPVVGEIKSARLLDFEPLFGIQDCRFVDLQYGDTKQERDEVRSALGVDVAPVDGIDNTQDLDGLAALISACDAVVTTSSTTAHIAGAVGKHTWILVPYGQGRMWYWFKKRTDSPWYPNVHLVRQELRESWKSVAARATSEVRRFLLGR